MKFKKITLFTLLLILVTLVGCGSPKYYSLEDKARMAYKSNSGDKTVEKKIEKVMNDLGKAAEGGDEKAIAELTEWFMAEQSAQDAINLYNYNEEEFVSNFKNTVEEFNKL